MSKKRIFDIEFPDEAPAPALEASQETHKRGPMAAAINENAGALRARAEVEQAIRAENDRLAHEHVRMKRDGLITDLVPLDQIRTDKLKRDRKEDRDSEIDELKASIRSIGLSNPIRLEVVGDGYELVQGYRRLTAYKELLEETGDPAYARIPAGLVAEGDALEVLYRRMVDENLVRRDISFAEMAMLANRYAADPAIAVSTVSEAVSALYGSAGRQKRNYIEHFASLMERIGHLLHWPEAIPRALGLDLEKVLSQRPEALHAFSDRLTVQPPQSDTDEVQALRNFLVDLAATKPKAARRKSKPGAKTTLRIERAGGLIKCTASDGSLELRGEADFSAIDRVRLERALDAFLDAIQGE
jgi:ParB family chromosome partitioning protein